MAKNKTPILRSITFGDAMMRQVLAMEKTLTCRLIKPPIDHNASPQYCFWVGGAASYTDAQGNCLCKPIKCRYGGKGDFLYIKENHYSRKFNAPAYKGQRVIFDTGEHAGLINAKLNHGTAISEFKNGPYLKANRYRRQSKMFMPKFAGRVILGVRNDPEVIRVQMLTDNECLMEGVPVTWADACRVWYGPPKGMDKHTWEGNTPGDNYRWLWNTIYAGWTPVVRGGEVVHYECYPWADEDTPPVPKKYKTGKPCKVFANPYVFKISFYLTNYNFQTLHHKYGFSY